MQEPDVTRAGEIICSFFTAGIPIPQGNAKAWVNKKTMTARVNAVSKPLDAWRKLIAEAAQPHARRVQGPLEMECTFYLIRPKSHPKTRRTWPTGRPDTDKLARGCADALTGVCYDDDAQLVKMTIEKVWAVGEDAAGVEVTLRRPLDWAE